MSDHCGQSAVFNITVGKMPKKDITCASINNGR